MRVKRVWRRWDRAEEDKLKDAVDKLGTKDWAEIHKHMGTDRSIKQVTLDSKSQPLNPVT